MLKHILKGTLFLTITAGSLTSVNAKKLVVYTQKIDAAKICGVKFAKTNCSTTFSNMNLKQSDIALETEDNGQPNHAQVLGRMYNDLAANAISTAPCGTILESHFAPKSAITNFVYRKKASSEFGASTSVDVKNALVAAGVPASQLKGLQAQFEAQYGRKSAAQYEIKGQYYRQALRSESTDQIRGVKPALDAGLKACGDALRASDDGALIYSVAVIQLDRASFVSDVSQEIAAAFAAKVASKNKDIDIAALKISVSSKIQASLNVDLAPEWRVVSWDYLQLT